MNAKKKVLVTFMPLNDAHLDQLAQAAGDGCELVYKQNGLTADDVRDASAIVGNVPPALLPECKALELLQLNSAGADPYAQPGTYTYNLNSPYGGLFNERYGRKDAFHAVYRVLSGEAE